MKSELYTKLFSILSLVASEKDYLENLTSHADAIHKHLGKVDIIDFEVYLQEYFAGFLKHLRKKTAWQNLTIAFDETYIPFYGRASDNWVNGYNNKIKGATGTYKFMVCSIIIDRRRFVLMIVPMHNNQDVVKTVMPMLEDIKKQFNIRAVLFDRGFCEKKLCRDLENQGLKYLILGKKFANIKKYMESKEIEIVESTIINENKTKTKFDWRFLFAYDQFGYDWAFATNLQMSPENLVLLYKCRWGIETNFRIMDLADIKSKSKNIVTRCFFFLISAVLFNSWLELDQEITFETYLDSVAIANQSLGEILSKFKEAKELLNIQITEEEQRILSSFVNFAELSGRFPCHNLRFQPCMNQAEI